MNKAIRHLRSDPAMAKAIDRIGPMKLKPRRHSTFQSLTQAVIHQQLSGKAAATIQGRFQALFGGDIFPEAHVVLKIPHEHLKFERTKQRWCREFPGWAT